MAHPKRHLAPLFLKLAEGDRSPKREVPQLGRGTTETERVELHFPSRPVPVMKGRSRYNHAMEPMLTRCCCVFGLWVGGCYSEDYRLFSHLDAGNGGMGVFDGRQGAQDAGQGGQGDDASDAPCLE